MKFNRESQMYFQKWCSNLQTATFPCKLMFLQPDERKSVLLRFYSAFSGLLVRWSIGYYVHWPFCEQCACILVHMDVQDESISAGHSFCEQCPRELCTWQLSGKPLVSQAINSLFYGLQSFLHSHPSLSFFFYFAHNIFYYTPMFYL